ncbi:hypothetical protein FPY71_11350 [Aureimonas fodinaquatilis]|uniref:Uncharacterized protein n=1 Tax=Aureimonas fodinaquatilis TaxID=2565783 RepID=A0A5B0E0Q0_9HYPH|nr:hypothetical protein FPY71_11350 [Aureimonas fodinaquatilis]
MFVDAISDAKPLRTFAEIAFFAGAISDAKPLRTFAEIAWVNSFPCADLSRLRTLHQALFYKPGNSP